MENDRFQVERSDNFFRDSNFSPQFAALIYHEKDVKPEIRPKLDYIQAKTTPVSAAAQVFIDESTIKFKKLKKRIQTAKTTCTLGITVDYEYYQATPGPTKASKISKIRAEVSQYIRAANEIFSKTDFKTDVVDQDSNNFLSYRNINFLLKKLVILDDKNSEANHYLRSKNIGHERYLNLASSQDYSDFCLYYHFTHRDFEGILGFAWVASPSQLSVGGICDTARSNSYTISGMSSKNTGLITTKNYGRPVNKVNSHLTFAHELGHSFGANHDPENTICSGAKVEDRYLMYSYAAGWPIYEKNRKFSTCSLQQIAEVLKYKSDCFITSNTAICGNGILDEGEICDCGWEDDCASLGDTCCHPAEKANLGCTLKKKAKCSPSQGPCCHAQTCKFKKSKFACGHQTDCQAESFCTGKAATCPAGKFKPDNTTCAKNTQTCQAGECTGSICLQYGLEECTCQAKSTSLEDRKILCHACCQKPNQPDTCQPTKSETFKQYFNGTQIYSIPGSSCDNFKGYCDVYQYCRAINPEGPIKRLIQLSRMTLTENFSDLVLDFYTDFYFVLYLVVAAVQ